MKYQIYVVFILDICYLPAISRRNILQLTQNHLNHARKQQLLTLRSLCSQELASALDGDKCHMMAFPDQIHFPSIVTLSSCQLNSMETRNISKHGEKDQCSYMISFITDFFLLRLFQFAILQEKVDCVLGLRPQF